jgi:hypothetical protein
LRKTAGVTFPHPLAAARAALDRLIASDPDLAAIEARAGPFPGAPALNDFASP